MMKGRGITAGISRYEILSVTVGTIEATVGVEKGPMAEGGTQKETIKVDIEVIEKQECTQ